MSERNIYSGINTGTAESFKFAILQALDEVRPIGTKVTFKYGTSKDVQPGEVQVLLIQREYTDPWWVRILKKLKIYGG